MSFHGLVGRTAYGVRRIFLLGTPVAVLLTAFLGGCIRVAGGAGCWYADQAGETTVKKAGFDTADLIPSDSVPGKITT